MRKALRVRNNFATRIPRGSNTLLTDQILVSQIPHASSRQSVSLRSNRRVVVIAEIVVPISPTHWRRGSEIVLEVSLIGGAFLTHQDTCAQYKQTKQNKTQL